jgi:beta-lactamase regulating signal transducer with metallopeptidase domain
MIIIPPEFLVSLAAVSTAPVAIAGAAVFLIRKTSAAWKHVIWMLSLAAPLVAFPFLVTNLRFELPVLERTEAPVVALARRGSELPATSPPLPALEPQAVQADAEQRTPAPPQDPAAPPPPATPALAPPNGWLIAWAMGAAALVLAFLVTHLRLHVAFRSALPVRENNRFSDAVESARNAMKLRRAGRVVVSEHTSIPLCYGVVRPVIVLPAESLQWDADKLRACLVHEMAHVARGDLRSIALARLSCVICWFNPLVWLAASMLRHAAESAADDAAVSGLIRPESYAATLLAVAEDAAFAWPRSLPALPMARPGRLKERLVAILDGKANRSAPRTRTIAGLLLSLALLVTISVTVRLVAAETTPQTPEEMLPRSVEGFNGLRSLQYEAKGEEHRMGYFLPHGPRGDSHAVFDQTDERNAWTLEYAAAGRQFSVKWEWAYQSQSKNVEFVRNQKTLEKLDKPHVHASGLTPPSIPPRESPILSIIPLSSNPDEQQIVAEVENEAAHGFDGILMPYTFVGEEKHLARLYYSELLNPDLWKGIAAQITDVSTTEVDGMECVRLTIEKPRSSESKRPPMTYQVMLAKDLNYFPIRWELTEEGGQVTVYTVQDIGKLEAAGSTRPLYYPKRADSKTTALNRTVSTSEITIENITVNEDIPESTFSIDPNRASVIFEYENGAIKSEIRQKPTATEPESGRTEGAEKPSAPGPLPPKTTINRRPVDSTENPSSSRSIRRPPPDSP